MAQSVEFRKDEKLFHRAMVLPTATSSGSCLPTRAVWALPVHQSCPARQTLQRHAVSAPDLFEAARHVFTVAQIPTNAATASNINQNASLLGGFKEVSFACRQNFLCCWLAG